MALAPLKGTYESRELGMCVDLEFPFRPGESFEDGLQRICTAVRDGLRIPPAPPTDPRAFARAMAVSKGRS